MHYKMYLNRLVLQIGSGLPAGRGFKPVTGSMVTTKVTRVQGTRVQVNRVRVQVTRVQVTQLLVAI